MIKILSTDFVKTATAPKEWPPEGAPEFAFIGRSNVGKSSMLNTLCRRKKLARTSNTPGRTRLLQFFSVGVELSPVPDAPPVRWEVSFCDLPGYGYAKISKEERKSWGNMIERYLRDRSSLHAVVLILDSRHPPSAEDREAFGFMSTVGRPLIVAATKIDKLPKNKRRPGIDALAKTLGFDSRAVVPFSSIDGTGFEEIWATFAEIASEA